MTVDKFLFVFLSKLLMSNPWR